MMRRKSSTGKWLALLTSFMGAMCCICLVLVYISGATNHLATTSTLLPVATTVVQSPFPKVVVLPSITISVTSSPTCTQTSTPTSTQTSIPTNTPTSTQVNTQTSTTTPFPTAIPVVLKETAMPEIPVSGSLRFHFVDIGQGDSTVIQTPNGQTILIDGGETNTGIVQYLQSLGIKQIDLMIATHPHSDHIGGLVQVLAAFPVSKVVTSGDPHTTSTYEHFLDGIFSARAEYSEVKRGDIISLDGISFNVLSPANNNNSDLNENSLVLRFTYGATTILMMGDAGAGTESALISAGIPLKATILKVGHHGSTSGSTPSFLNEVKPEIALYSAGINNSYHHPAPSTITALAAVGATIYGTDKNGTINIDVGSNGYTINTNKSSVEATAESPIIVTPIVLPGGSGGLEISSITSPVSKGANATLTAKTSPGASCSITVYTKSGTSTAAGLSSKSADASGAVSWTWKVGSRTTSGIWPIKVICGDITQETKYEVR